MVSENVRHHTPRMGFGILIPGDTGVTFHHQSGGASCIQVPLEGVYLQLSHPRIFQGHPDWLPRPNGLDPDASHPVTTVDLETISDRDYETLPEWVKERGHFYNFDEYTYWYHKDDVWWYGARDLIKELRMMLYDPKGEMYESGLLDTDITERWDSLSELWDVIDEKIHFEYEEITPWEQEDDLPDSYEKTGAWKWITIQGSKVDGRGRVQEEWAEDLAGETVILTHPNSD